jgi:serine/threonine protein kinase
VDDGAPLALVPDAFGEGGLDVDPMLGRVLAGRFSIRARLGSGSMGTVYRAVQAPIGREVALKILRTDRAVDDASRARFLREARANSALTSPNTVTVFDFGQSESGEFYLAMELLEGESFGDRIRRLGRLGVADALEATQQALRSLAEAHAKGIIHRDLKPDNLFFARVPSEPTGEIVKVLDFGVAKMLREDGDFAMNAVETQAGTVFGTPRYMSPEQAQGKPLDARTDIYSLGVILYHMLSGHPPFTDDDAIVVMARHIKSNPVPLSEAAPDCAIPPEVVALVMRALSKEPDLRPASAEAMLAEVKSVIEALSSAGRLANGARESLAPASRTASVRPPDDTWNDRSSARPRPKGRRLGLLAAAFAAAVAGAFAAALIARLVASGGEVRTAEPAPLPANPLPASTSAVGRGGASTPSAVIAEPAPTEAVAAASEAPPLPAARSGGQLPAPARSRPAAPPQKKPDKPKVGYGYLE